MKTITQHITSAIAALKAHDLHHHDFDDHDGYPGSELQTQHLAALAGLEALLELKLDDTLPGSATPDPGWVSPAEWMAPTTYLQRLGDAMQLLCAGIRPTDEVLTAWLDKDRDDVELQEFAVEHGPAWAQGIGVIDAARLLAETPTEGVDHEDAPKPAQGSESGEANYLTRLIDELLLPTATVTERQLTDLHRRAAEMMHLQARGSEHAAAVPFGWCKEVDIGSPPKAVLFETRQPKWSEGWFPVYRCATNAARSIGHLKAALGVARMALDKRGGLDMRIAGNGPTVGEAIETALAGVAL